MALSLEHVKLLHPKVAALEIGTGGTPDISWHEVCDMLARVSMPCRSFARYVYAQDPAYRRPLVDAVTFELFMEDQKNKRPLARTIALWRPIVELALMMTVKRLYLTRRQKREEAGLKRWRRHHEKALGIAINSMDVLDYDLRVAIKEWNDDNHHRVID